MRTLRELVAEREVERVVVGLPLSLSGGDSDQTREARAFADRLRSALDGAVPVDLYDERFTTAIAARSAQAAARDQRGLARGGGAARRLARPARARAPRSRRMSRSADEREAARLERERAARDASAARRRPSRRRPSHPCAGRRRSPTATSRCRRRRRPRATRPGRGTSPSPSPSRRRARAADPLVPERARRSTGIPTTSRSARSRRRSRARRGCRRIGPVTVPQAPAQARALAARSPCRSLLLAIVVGWIAWSTFTPFKGDGSGEVAVAIPAGASTREIGDLLADKGVVGSGFFFALRAGIGGDDLRAGRFTLRRDMGNAEAIVALTHVPGGAEADPPDAARGPVAPRAGARAWRARASRATT